jgi:hypothetical protein
MSAEIDKEDLQRSILETLIFIFQHESSSLLDGYLGFIENNLTIQNHCLSKAKKLRCPVANSIYLGSYYREMLISSSSVGVCRCVSRKDMTYTFLIILGIGFFLVGANYYNSFVGWLGVFLLVAGILLLILFYVYRALTKRKSERRPQNP